MCSFENCCQQEQYRRAQSDVNETFQFYMSVLDDRKAELLKELESVYNSKQFSLSTVNQKAQETIDRVRQTCDFFEKLMKCASPAQILMFKKIIENKLCNAINYCPDFGLQNASELEFVSNFSAIQTGVQNTFGYIRSSPDIQMGTNKQPPIARPANGFHNNGFSSFNNGPFSTMNAINDHRSVATPRYSLSGSLVLFFF